MACERRGYSPAIAVARRVTSLPPGRPLLLRGLSVKFQVPHERKHEPEQTLEDGAPGSGVE